MARYGNSIGKLDVVTEETTYYPIPAPRSDARRIAADAQGNLWVGVLGANRLMKLDARTGEFTQYELPTPNSGPHSPAVDLARNMIWVGESLGDKLARLNPADGTFQEFPLPTAGSDVRRLQVDPSNPNRVWWSGLRSNRIGYVELLD